MPVIYQQHNNAQIFLTVCIFPVGAAKQLLVDGLENSDNDSPEIFRALVDTGATSSCITKEVATKVELNPIGQVPVQGVSGVAG